MRHVIHLLKKDLLAMRWPLALLYALIAVQTGLALRDPLVHPVISQSVALIPLLSMLAVLGVAGLLVQQELLVGTTAFWMTRPIPRSSLLISKLLFLVVFIVIPSALSSCIVIHFYNLSPAWIPSLLWSGAATLMTMLLGSVLLASVTSGIAAYAAAWILYVLSDQLFDAVTGAILQQKFSVGSDSSATLTGFTVAAIVGGGLIFHQYFTLRTRRTIFAILVTLVAINGATRIWLLTLKDLPAPEWFSDQVTVAVAASGPEDSFIASRDLDSATMITVNTDVLRSPPAQDIRIASLDGDLRLDSDHRVPIVASDIHLPAGALGSVFPNFQRVGVWDRSKVILRVAPEHAFAFEHFIGKPAQFRGIAEGRTFKYRVAGRIPLVAGARFNQEDYGAIVREATLRDTGVEVKLRVRYLAPARYDSPRWSMVLVNQPLLKMAEASQQSTQSEGGHSFGFIGSAVVTTIDYIMYFPEMGSSRPDSPRLVPENEIAFLQEIPGEPFRTRVESSDFRTVYSTTHSLPQTAAVAGQ